MNALAVLHVILSIEPKHSITTHMTLCMNNNMYIQDPVAYELVFKDQCYASIWRTLIRLSQYILIIAANHAKIDPLDLFLNYYRKTRRTIILNSRSVHGNYTCYTAFLYWESDPII